MTDFMTVVCSLRYSIFHVLCPCTMSTFALKFASTFVPSCSFARMHALFFIHALCIRLRSHCVYIRTFLLIRANACFVFYPCTMYTAALTLRLHSYLPAHSRECMLCFLSMHYVYGCAHIASTFVPSCSFARMYALFFIHALCIRLRLRLHLYFPLRLRA